MSTCTADIYVALLLTSLALVASVCGNITLYLFWRRDKRAPDAQNNMHSEPFQDTPRTYYRQDEEEEQQQDNPIYGNVNQERLDAEEHVLYEDMQTQAALQVQPRNPDVAYASLDLVGGKRRKWQGTRLEHGLSQQEFLPLEVDGTGLPPRHSSPMASHTSIYLNSQQVALQRGAELVHEDPAQLRRERLELDSV